MDTQAKGGLIMSNLQKLKNALEIAEADLEQARRVVSSLATIAKGARDAVHAEELKKFNTKKYIGKCYKWGWLDSYYYVQEFDTEKEAFVVLRISMQNQKDPTKVERELILVRDYYNHMEAWQRVTKKAFQEQLSKFGKFRI